MAALFPGMMMRTWPCSDLSTRSFARHVKQNWIRIDFTSRITEINSESIVLDHGNCEDETIRGYGEENVRFLPLACYSPHWDIKVSYYESKTFWSLEEYCVRSREGIERLINLECMAYSAMTLLSYSDRSFSCYQSASAQETHFGIGQQIQASIIFGSFIENSKLYKNMYSDQND